MTTFEYAKSKAYEMHRNGVEKVYAVFYENYLDEHGHGRECVEIFPCYKLAENFYAMFATCGHPVAAPIEM